jgi:hypothetical protein
MKMVSSDHPCSEESLVYCPEYSYYPEAMLNCLSSMLITADNVVRATLSLSCISEVQAYSQCSYGSSYVSETQHNVHDDSNIYTGICWSSSAYYPINNYTGDVKGDIDFFNDDELQYFSDIDNIILDLNSSHSHESNVANQNHHLVAILGA